MTQFGPQPHPTPRRRRAATLLDSILFIAIAMGLVTSGLVFYRQANLALWTSETVLLAASLVAETEALYRRSPPAVAADSWTPLNRILDASGSLSASRGDETCPIRTPWAGCARVSAFSFPGSWGYDGYWISYERLPIELCSRLAVFDRGQSGPLGPAIARMAVWPDNRPDPMRAPDGPGHYVAPRTQGRDGAGVFCRLAVNLDGTTNLGVAFRVAR